MDPAELRAQALAKLAARGVTPRKLLEPEELDELRATFERLDADADGSIDRTALRELLGAAQDSERLLEASDIPGNGRMSHAQLIEAAVSRRLTLREREAWNTFSHFDIDADGFVDRTELGRLASAGASAESVTQLLADVDDDGNGKIDYAEFLIWYTGG